MNTITNTIVSRVCSARFSRRQRIGLTDWPNDRMAFSFITYRVWVNFMGEMDGSNGNNNNFDIVVVITTLQLYADIQSLPLRTHQFHSFANDRALSVRTHFCVCVFCCCCCPAAAVVCVSFFCPRFQRWIKAFFHRFILFRYVWRRVVSSSCLFMIFFPLCWRSLFCLLFIVVPYHAEWMQQELASFYFYCDWP